MAFKLGMAVDMHGLYAHVRFDDLDLDFCKARPFFSFYFQKPPLLLSPWFNLRGSLGVKNLSIYLSSSPESLSRITLGSK